MRYDYQQQAQEEMERRLVEALDRFHRGQETADDLSLIKYATGLRNYKPKGSEYGTLYQ